MEAVAAVQASQHIPHRTVLEADAAYLMEWTLDGKAAHQVEAVAAAQAPQHVPRRVVLAADAAGRVAGAAPRQQRLHQLPLLHGAARNVQLRRPQPRLRSDDEQAIMSAACCTLHW